MQISNFYFLPVLCMSLTVPVAMAESISVPDKNHRQGMTYEEYSNYREKMRTQMEMNRAEDLKQKQAPANAPTDQTEKSTQDSAYGKGYHSRNQKVDKPDAGAANRPDRPRMERFNRGDMGRR